MRRPRRCVVCNAPFRPPTRDRDCCSALCIKRRRYGIAVEGCTGCAAKNAGCDTHQVPPVCICDVPDPDKSDQCTSCKRPYALVYVPLREAWRTHLGAA